MKQILLVSFILFSFILSGQNQKITDNNRINEIKNNITRAYDDINNIRCNYIQEKSVSLLENDIKSEGEVIFIVPNNLYWKNNYPESQSFILKNDSVKVINNEGVDIMPIEKHLIFREVLKIINNAVSNKSIIDEKNFVSSYEENENYIIVNMVPKKNKMKNFLGNMRLHFDDISYLIHKIEIIDNNSDITTILLSDICINQEIDKSLFNF